MGEKINTPEKDLSLSFPLTPESGQELADTLGSFGFSLWGHGTLVSDPTPFFEKGVLSGNYSSLHEMAIPLTPSEEGISDTIADPDFMANRWPHRGDSHPNVALLAVPNPDPEDNVYAAHVTRHVIDPENGTIPPELVVGWYSPTTNNVELNPAFDLQEGSHGEQLGHIRARAAEAASRSGPLDLMPSA
jgi:hypothetical protein